MALAKTLRPIIMAGAIGVACMAAGCGGGRWSEPRWDAAQHQDNIQTDRVLRLPEDERPFDPAPIEVMSELPARIIRIWKPSENAQRATEMTADDVFPDQRRKGIYYLADYPEGRKSPKALALYRLMAVQDEDESVRVAAIRVLNRARDAGAATALPATERGTNLFVGALYDESPAVRYEAAKALANMPDESGVLRLEQLLVDTRQPREVRIASAWALRHFRNDRTAKRLIGVLLDRDFGLAWTARQSLWLMTGKNFEFDPEKWTAHFGAGKPFAS